MENFIYYLTLIGLAAGLFGSFACRAGSSERSAAFAICIVLNVQAVAILLGYSII